MNIFYQTWQSNYLIRKPNKKEQTNLKLKFNLNFGHIEIESITPRLCQISFQTNQFPGKIFDLWLDRNDDGISGLIE
jgi:hypothetical protein